MRGVVWVVVAMMLAYVAYGGMMSAWQWFQVANVVDEALHPRNATDSAAVQSYIVKNSNDAGVPLTEREVVVTDAERTLSVRIVWTYPVIVYYGETVLAVPLSVRRTKETATASR